MSRSFRDLEARIRAREAREQTNGPRLVRDWLYTVPPLASYSSATGDPLRLTMVPVPLTEPFELGAIVATKVTTASADFGVALYKAINPRGTRLEFERITALVPTTMDEADWQSASIARAERKLLMDPSVWYYVGLLTTNTTVGEGWQIGGDSNIACPTCETRAHALDFPERATAHSWVLGAPSITLASPRYYLRTRGRSE